MALSHLRSSTSFIRRGHSVRSASCVAGSSGSVGQRRLPLLFAGNNNYNNYHGIAKSRMLSSSRQFLSAPLLFSSTNTDNIDDAQNQKRNMSISTSEQTQEGEEKEWTEYERLVRKLYMTNLFNPVKLGLENMDRLHKILGSPMDQPNISIVHIAGSNGKGSVALKTANALQLSNYKVGLFVSPHISSFRERIQINGQPISESQVVKYLQEIFDICERENHLPATFFEVTTALAFHIFAKEGVEVVVLETGLGGRLDATNVIQHPALSIITSIGLEHTRILGDTIEKIALEKGGIIKEGCQVLVGKGVPLEVLQQCAKEKGASDLFECDDILGPEDGGMTKKKDATATTSSLLFEDYDAENSRIASAALILLQFHLTNKKIESGGDSQVKLISHADIEKGVKIRPPCRFEEMDIPTTITVANADGSSTKTQKIVRVILDVAHNPQAMDYLMVKLRSNYPNTCNNQRMVVGMSADKDIKYCTDILLDHVSQHPEKLHLVEAAHPRAASVASILEANPKLIGSSHYDDNDTLQDDDLNNEDDRDDVVSSSVSKQVRSALQLAARNDELLVICGSVFIMADAREELGIVEPRDSAVIAEVAGAGLGSSQENFGADDGAGGGEKKSISSSR
eukprot:CAMPEP_0172311362 /NCGR_PEP_ID=MMETSP1058-20130122/14630_1 /TAXON_ID=83371 /ORGANISM="Detonula confervacea, Strain CCMP 353" /LENGTH=626 /DNA_ID=CAMNT_0013024521 /DNA_START=95 /DNA_END=1975 /DNA_ORIENTATION=+